MLSVAQVAKRLGVSSRTVTRLIVAGELTAHQIGSVYRVAAEDLAAYLARTRVEVTQ